MSERYCQTAWLIRQQLGLRGLLFVYSGWISIAICVLLPKRRSLVSRFVLALQSSFRPRRVPNILVDWAPSVPKAMVSSLPSWHFSSNSSMDSLTTSFPVFSSSVHPTNVESSANSVSVIFMVSLSLLYRILDGSAAGKQLPGVHVQVSPHSWIFLLLLYYAVVTYHTKIPFRP